MPQTSGKGVPTGRNVVTGIKLGTGKVGGGALAPSAQKALYPAGRATNPKVSSVGAIPAAKPKAGKRPNVHPVQRP